MTNSNPKLSSRLQAANDAIRQFYFIGIALFAIFGVLLTAYFNIGVGIASQGPTMAMLYMVYHYDK